MMGMKLTGSDSCPAVLRMLSFRVTAHLSGFACVAQGVVAASSLPMFPVSDTLHPCNPSGLQAGSP
jgi:hypothetical protein